ncbi:TonB-dependent receptor [Pedobacter frigoris]|uniref:TonB-dependent receptor n=1 Tax=Pedobacter frigoris TaxID=2571272 RepID=A0A4U1CFQ7_9SPHI|nr:TonB-dependent receptor [Pedobacter frigoris]TKC06012.1 TonB-dependent receptor [Pedobacter frigoris]
MQIKNFLLLGILCANVFFSKAQTEQANLSGRLISSAGEPIPAASVKLQNSRHGAISDQNGYYKISNVKPASYILQVNAIGFKLQKKEIKLLAGENGSVNFTLTESTEQMETVTVLGRTKAQEVNRQAFNVTAIDATKLYNTTLDISSALDRVAGVRVRESGGVGSNFNLSLNGFSGRHVRFFIDGIPMDNMGSSFQINNIPINVAERVEVYKGVVPMWLGSDALGGAVNIVTGDKHRNYLDASYSYGSFNTHRSVINTAVTSKSGLTLQLSAFQNYSDNNYKIQIEQLLQNNMAADKKSATVRRFHDVYHNETLIANVGIVGKSWADNLLLGVTLGQNYKEMQNAATPIAVYGQLHRRGNIVMPSLKYKKVDLIPGLDVTLNANYNLGYETTIDTAKADYDWDGIRDGKPSMGENENGQHRNYWNNNGLATAMVSYKLGKNHGLAINNVFSTFDRKQKDLLFPDLDAKNTPKKMDKNVLGLGYSYNVDNKWSLNIFGKHILLRSVVNGENNKESNYKIGYGTALAYYVKPDLQIRGSYELANRIPEANEVFGNLENFQGNPSLKPEKSNNLNLGIIYGFKINEINRFSITANAIYRNASDYIYTHIVGGTGPRREWSTSSNRQGVRTTGFDGEIRYSYKNWLSAGGTITYQKTKNLQKHDWDPNTGKYSEAISWAYLDQMPNIPYFFGNADVSASFKNAFGKGNNLTVGYNMLFVDRFWLDWPSFGNPTEEDKYSTAVQLTHDVNFVYSMKNGKYNISLEARNIADKPVFDNFALQKPGRGFYLNFRYFINKSQR